MRCIVLGIAAAACALPQVVLAACENPSLVAVPDGTAATMEELLAAQANVKAYLAEMEAYLACVNEEITAAGEAAPEEFKSMMVTRHNAAVTEMETVAELFNKQVVAYRAAHPEPAAE